MNTFLIYPMAAMVLLTTGVGIILFISRVKGVRAGAVRTRYFKQMSGEGAQTDLMINSARHFSNLFEVPVLFYAACITAMVLPLNGPGILVSAWVFVAARCLHAFIHVGPNKLRFRMGAFFMGSAAVLAMWIKIVIAVSMRG
jgi:hypothetical protein